jgi:hypothetical protein
VIGLLTLASAFAADGCGHVSPMVPTLPAEREQIKRRVDEAVAEIVDREWNAFQPHWWGMEADHLLGLALSLGPPKPAPPGWPCLPERAGWRWEDADWRVSMFRLYLQISRSVASRGETPAPFFVEINRVPVDYFGWLAGVMAWQDRTLLLAVTGAEVEDLSDYLGHQIALLEKGAYGKVERFGGR